MRDLFWCILTAWFVVVQCETIHFTNSPSHLIGTKNITSYKLLVKNSDPITIIEANKEGDERSPMSQFHERYHANDRIDINVDDGADSAIRDYPVKLLANMGGSHQVNTINTQHVRGTLGFTVTGGPSNVPGSIVNDFKKSDLDGTADSSGGGAKKVVYSPILLKKFMQEYSEKLKNADNSVKSEIQKIHEKIHGQQTTDDDKHESLEFDKSIENAEQKFNLNGYRDSYDDEKRRRPTNRYKDPDGWVTLEAVPWSSSTVSKWHPHGDDDTRRRPSHRPYNNKPDRYTYHDDDVEVDFYSRPKPGNIDRDSRPGVYSTWTKPQPMYNNDRPRPKPYRFSESGSFNDYKYHDNDRYSSRPFTSNGDIITANGPSDFPSESNANKYHDDDHYHAAASTNYHDRYHDRPSENNGEWVLISTTKGYQFPNRRQQGKRALFQPNDKQSSVTVNVAPPQSIRMHKTLKLTVLPALDPDKNSTFSTDPKRKPTTTIHGGMLEVDATHETIEDDVRATLLAQKKLTTVHPVKAPAIGENKNRKLLKGNFKIEEKHA